MRKNGNGQAVLPGVEPETIGFAGDWMRFMDVYERERIRLLQVTL